MPYLEALEMVPPELGKLLLFLLTATLHATASQGLVGNDLVAFEAGRLLRLGVFYAV